jgi:3',5'-cyclic AMP phosphodiesterase CpdA
MLDHTSSLLGRIPCLALLTGFAIMAPQARSQEKSNRPAPVAAEAYRATEFPDRVILTISGDPARSMAVSWRTDSTVSRPEAQLALADHGPQFEPQAKSIPAVTTSLVSQPGRNLFHSVKFESLKPGTRYLYRVGDGAHWSEWSGFQTASTSPEPFQFLYLGDAQNSIKSHWSRVIRAAFAAAPGARFIIHAGDLVDKGTNDAYWGEWFQAAGWINQVVPSVPSPGNHEYEKGKADQTQDPTPRITAHWRAQFALPENGPEGLEETAYFVDYQGVRFISLNSNEGQGAQSKWLHQVLGQNTNRWIVIAFHHPIYSSAKSRDNATIRKLWQPIFDRYHVDLVLQGHDHTYARTGLQTASAEDSGGSTPDGQGGTVYVNSVAGPKQYQLDQKPEQKRTAEGTQLFQVISIDGDRLHFEARTALGELYDAFELKKHAGQPNGLIELGPGTPERHTPPPVEQTKAGALKAALAR